MSRLINPAWVDPTSGTLCISAYTVLFRMLCEIRHLSLILVLFWKKVSGENIQEALMKFLVKGDEPKFGGNSGIGKEDRYRCKRLHW